MLGDTEHHHIIDPATGTNRSELVSVTLISDRCVSSDAYTKALFNLPPEESLAFALANDMNALVITKDGKILQTEGFAKKYDADFT